MAATLALPLRHLAVNWLIVATLDRKDKNARMSKTIGHKAGDRFAEVTFKQVSTVVVMKILTLACRNKPTFTRYFLK